MTDPATEALPADGPGPPNDAAAESGAGTSRPRRLPPLTIGLIATAGALVLALISVGVVFALNAPGAASESPSASPSTPLESASPSAESASPSAEPVDPPWAALPVECAQLLPATSVVGIFSAPLELTHDGSSALRDADDVVWANAGASNCVWSTTGGSGASLGSGVMLTAVPAGAAGYARSREGVGDTQYTVLDTVGDRSDYSCLSYYPYNNNIVTCSGNVLVDEYWLSIDLNASGEPTVLDEVTNAQMHQLMSGVASAVRGSGAPRAEWQVPEPSYSGVCAQRGLDAAAYAFERDYQDPGEEGGVWTTSSEAHLRSHTERCAWYAGQNWVAVLAIPGGEWAVPQFTAQYPRAFTPVDVRGADAAFVDCAAAYGCRGIIAAQGDLLQISTDGAQRAEFVEALGRYLEALGEGA